MRGPGFIVTLVLAIACGLSVDVRADDNAADGYRDAFGLLDQLSPEHADTLAAFAASSNPQLTPDVVAALDAARPIIRAMERASRADSIDWGIDFSPGPGTLLPHLAPMRSGMRLLAADAQARFLSGDAAGGSAALADVIRMSDHVTQGPVLISTLVGISMYRGADTQIDRAIGEGALGQTEARELLGAIGGVLGDDPFRVTEAIGGERDVFAGWLIDRYSEEGGRERLLEEADMFFLDDADPFMLTVADMSQAELNGSLMQYDAALGMMHEAMHQDDLGAAMNEVKGLVDRAVAGEFGPFAAQMMPSLDRVLEIAIETYQSMSERIDALTLIANDPEGAKKLRNAALWYLRAIEMHDDLEPAAWQRLAVEPKALAAEANDALANDVAQAQPIIDVLLEAATIERCDFDLQDAWKRDGVFISLAHLPGMSRNAYLLRAAAHHAADPDVARELTSACLRMSTHAASDHRTPSIRAAADVMSCALDALSQDGADGVNASAAGDTPGAVERAVQALRSALSRTLSEYQGVTSQWLLERYIEPGRVRETVMEEIAGAAATSSEPHAMTLPQLSFDDATAALRELDRAVESALAGEARIDQLIQSYGEVWPIELAQWVLEPLEETGRAVEDVEARARTVPR